MIIDMLMDGIHSLSDMLQKTEGFNAKFGSERDISSRFNQGFLISDHRKLTKRKSFENVMIAGPTGSGKTTRLLIKNLFELKNCSIVVNDPSKELFLLSSGYLSNMFNVKTLNFSDSKESCGYNLLSRIRNPNDINKIAHLLVSSTIDKNASDPFWGLQSKAMLSVFIRLVRHQPKEFQNMVNVLHVLNHFAANPKKVDAWIVKTADEKLILDYKAILAMPPKTLMNIVASSKAALQIFDDPEIARVTAYDTLNFEEFRERPTILFLHNNIADQKYISILNSIFFEQLYGYILEALPQKQHLDMFIILEEASSLYVPVLPVAIANTRKHRVGNLICVQSVGQLKKFYNEDADNISANCVTKVYLPGQTSMDVLREIETLSGKCIYRDDKDVERVKPLISIDEIRLLPEDRTLIISANNPLIKGRTSPYYKDWTYRSYAEIPPIPLRGDIPDEPLALI